MATTQDRKPDNPGGVGRWFWVAFLLALGALTLFNTVRTRPISDKAYAKEAIARVLKSPGAGAHARVTVIAADGSLRRACGWVDLGPPRGVAPFRVDGRPGERWATVQIGDPFGGSLKDQAVNIFYLAQDRAGCDRNLSTPRPANFALPPQALDTLARMWDEPPQPWAIIQPPGRDVFIGLQRRSGGGVIITPPFATALDADHWIKAEGDALAAAEQARGKAAGRADDVCLKQAKDDAARDRCGAGLDETVQLVASPAAAAAPGQPR